MSELKPLSKKITNEIRWILEGCRDGKLKHNQEAFHCGTAHCIAGWKVTLDASKMIDGALLTADFGEDEGALPKMVNGWDLTKFRRKNARYIWNDDFDDWAYAQSKWRLIGEEASGLFDWRRTFEQQFALLEKLENGERIK